MREQNRYIYTKGLVATLMIAFSASALSAWGHSVARDSIGMEIRDGQEMIIHRIKAKETYFGISRFYNVPVASLIDANNNKPLKIADTLFVPTGRMRSNQQPADTEIIESVTDSVPAITDEEIGEYTTYKVGNKETLFAISQRFRISVASIKRANNLASDSIQDGMLLKVPHKELPEPPSPASSGPNLSDIIVHQEELDDNNAPQPNRFGIREHNDKGIGVWMDNLNQDAGNMLALHQTAPIGTVIKITNPMTKLTTFVKVVGKFSENAETKGALIVISKSAASQIGVLDRRFQIEIAYGAPVTN